LVKEETLRKYYIYIHTRFDTREIFYIGKGTGSRWIACSNRNKYWNNIKNKAGGYNAKKIAQNLTNSEACQLEIQLISFYKALGLCKTNLSSGGESGSNGVKPWNYGKKLSKEHTYKCGNAFRGKKRPAHSKFMKEYYKTHPVPAKGKPAHNRRKVKCIDTGKIYSSIRLAAKELNIHSQHISKVCSGKLKTTGGYRFEYI